VLANAVQFKIHQQRADELGRSLGTLLKSWLWCRKKKINLIGHSLGARVIQQALLHANLDESTIRDCVLLGGAADTNPETWRQCANRIEGSIYNFYSDADKVLLITPDITKWVGRNPIECGSPNIHNIHKSGWGHGDYWKKIDQILYADWPTPDEHEAGR
jgi:pimeloyl-ACP methyl ester carboxylesterase